MLNWIHKLINSASTGNLVTLYDAINALKTNPRAINETTNKGNNALHIACSAGHDLIAQTLLENGADPKIINSQDESPLFISVKNGNLKLVNLLINKSDVNQHDHEGHSMMYYALMNAGLEYGDDYDCNVILQKLLAKKPILTSHDNFPQLYAVMCPYPEIMAPILAKHPEIINARDTNANTTLIHLIKQTTPELEPGDTLIKCLRALLEKNPNVNAQGARGDTALMTAIRTNCEEAVRLVLAMRPNVNLKNKHDQTAIKLAADCDSSPEIIDLLLAAMCKNFPTRADVGLRPLPPSLIAEPNLTKTAKAQREH